MRQNWKSKPWKSSVFDNGFDGSGFENGQPIESGNIVVHTEKIK